MSLKTDEWELSGPEMNEPCVAGMTFDIIITKHFITHYTISTELYVALLWLVHSS
jgi:hypothetical protein